MNCRFLCGWAIVLSACGYVSPSIDQSAVDIRWTSYGVPHITANNWKAAGYGQGYAFAKENLCTLADQIVKVRSERSKWFGPGSKNVNITSDFAYKALEVMPHAQIFWDTQMTTLAQDVVSGYVAGFNAQLAEKGKDHYPTPCKGAEWVQPITAIDLVAYYSDLALIASGRNFKDYLANAHPPGDHASLDWLQWLNPQQRSEQGLAFGRELKPLYAATLGSNGWGLGQEKVEKGGAVLANPHFPWFGELRLWESHVTIPGVVDVAGVSLSGVAGVLIGHNAHVAWTETVSESRKFTAYRLALDPADPTSYLVDKVSRKMTSHSESIQVKQDDGSLQTQTRKFWKSHVGPILVVGGVGEWTDTTAFTIRDGNALNGKLVDHFLGFATAKSAKDLENICRNVEANPWTNTMAADDTGNAFYTESHSTPNVSAETMKRWQQAVKDDFVTGILAQNGVILLDGSTSDNDWVVKPGARENGLTPWEETPHLTRQDFVFNANDSHWLTNPASLLEGYNGMFGPERTRRSLRTRLNLKFLTEKGAGTAAGEDGKFTAAELEALIFGDRVHSADVALADLLTAVQAVTAQTVDGNSAQLKQALDILTKWDKTSGPDGKGALLWREFWYAYLSATQTPNLSDKQTTWAHPFDLADPIGTPYGLPLTPTGTANPAVEALGTAISALQAAKIPLDAAVPDFQYTQKGDKKIAIHGADDTEGAFQVVGWSFGENDTQLPDLRMQNPPQSLTNSGLSGQNYPVNYGSSFIMVCMLTPDGPQARAILTYGQSSDPQSPQFTDQTELFSQRKFRPMPFTDAEIEADPALVRQSLHMP